MKSLGRAEALVSDEDDRTRPATLETADAKEGADVFGDELGEATGLRSWLSGRALPREVALTLGLFMPAALLAASMWHVRGFTIDDSYISYRYARNFANGLGLVYNAGEHIEGYTNFLWTLMLGVAMKIGFEPDRVAKVLGALCAFGGLGMTYLLSCRLRPRTWLPVVSTWLLASSAVFGGYAVFGLETALFVFLVLAGAELFFREEAANVDIAAAWRGGGIRRLGAVPWSGLIFGLAGITRPEAPMYLGIFMLFLGLRIFSPRNLLRGGLFVLPVSAHLLFRHSYYGTWLPNTLSAKTGGSLANQMEAGWGYVQNYVSHASPILWLAVVGVAVGIVGRRRDVLSIAALALAIIGYVTLVGGDWMPFFRFLSPFEPFCFLLVDLGIRTIGERRHRATNLALGAFLVMMALYRGDNLRSAERTILAKEDRFWKNAAGGTARWLLMNEPGEIAIGDIGYVGYATNYPVLDLLGLVDPVISQLPGAYTRKLGPGFTDRFFDKAPLYFLLISSSMDCEHPSVPGSQVIYHDHRFRDRYAVGGKVPLEGGYAWCIYKRNR